MGKQINGSLTKLDSVKHWFYGGKFPYWTLYRGQPQSKSTTEAIISKNVDFDDIDESWEMLSAMLTQFENGVFTILAKPKPESSSGLNRVVYSPGMVEDSETGINGLSIQNGIQGGINAIIEKEKKVWELEKKVQDLESSMTVKETYTDKIMGMLEANMPLLLENVIPMLMNKFFPTPLGAIAGQPKIETIDQNEIIHNSLSRIALHFDLVETLPKLADWIELNPELAKSLLK